MPLYTPCAASHHRADFTVRRGLQRPGGRGWTCGCMLYFPFETHPLTLQCHTAGWQFANSNVRNDTDNFSKQITCLKYRGKITCCGTSTSTQGAAIEAERGRLVSDDHQTTSDDAPSYPHQTRRGASYVQRAEPVNHYTLRIFFLFLGGGGGAEPSTHMDSFNFVHTNEESKSVGGRAPQHASAMGYGVEYRGWGGGEGVDASILDFFKLLCRSMFNDIYTS